LYLLSGALTRNVHVGVVGGITALAVVGILVGNCTQPGNDWREERKKQIAAWKERRNDWREERKKQIAAWKERRHEHKVSFSRASANLRVVCAHLHTNREGN